MTLRDLSWRNARRQARDYLVYFVTIVIATALMYAFNGLVFSRDGEMIWQCSNCGHIHVGKQAPEMCPVCAHPKAYFQLKAENY